MNEECSEAHQATSDYDLTCFMFGNVDESGQLEDDDVLDNNEKKYLTSLSKLGFSSILSEVIGSTELQNIGNGHEDVNSNSEKLASAQDYFDIDELANEETNSIYECDYDGDNEQNDKKIDKSKRLETPLAAMLPSKYENVDVTTLFPDFRVGKVIFTLLLHYKYYIIS